MNSKMMKKMVAVAVSAASLGLWGTGAARAGSQVSVHQDGAPAGVPAAAGDVVLTNGSLAAVVKKDGSGVDLCATSGGAWKQYARVLPAAGGKPLRITGLTVTAGGGAEGAVKAAVEGGGALVFAMKAEGPILKATVEGKVESLRIAAPCRLGVLPDFFGDDLMVDARRIPAARTEIPSDNFFLQMAADGEAVVAALWEKNVRDLELGLSGEGDGRRIEGADVFFGGDGSSVFAAVLAGKNIWYSREFSREDGLKGVSMDDWPIPFLAKWKGDLTREDGGVESMELLYKQARFIYDLSLKKKGDSYVATVSDKLRSSLEHGQEVPDGKQELSKEGLPKSAPYVGLKGVGVFYPISRTEETPLDRLCLDDLLRLSLGTGPCESILDLDARKPAYKGIFTCSYGGAWGKLMPKNTSGPFQERDDSVALKEERRYFEHMTKQTTIFVTHVQDRINGYVDFGNELMKYLDEQEKKHPEQAEFIGKIRGEWAKPAWQYARPKVYGNHEKSVNAEIASGLLTEFFKSLHVDTPEQVALGRRGAGQVPGDVGDPGDRRLKNLRRKVMVLRSMAAMEMAMNPAVADTAREIRTRTEAALRNPAAYERVTVW